MKKILLASTALAFSAGIAGAQGVTIGGEGRMGIVYASAGGVSAWAQENRLQFNFSVSVEGDHGLKFGAFTRARMTNGGSTTVVTGGLDTDFDGQIDTLTTTTLGGTFSGSRVWVEANNLRLTFGNVDGAVRGAGAAFGYLGGCAIGYTGGVLCGDTAGLLGVTQGFASTGGGAVSRARIDYSMGSTRIAVSADRGGATEVGVRTSFDAFTVAAGYTSLGTGVTTVSGYYNGGSWGIGAIVANGGGTTNYSIGGNAALGGGTLNAYVGRVGGLNTYGVGYAYGLGGGASLKVGVERVGGLTAADLGVVFSF